jgi:DNA-directed RNA polymerase specialized sigma24 family protein
MEVTTIKKSWSLKRESFERLLSLFDADRERAGEQYEALRAKLIRLFEWRGADSPEEHADETLDRVVRKVEEGEDVRDVHAFAGGVARLVWLESVKRERRERVALEQMPPREETAAAESDARLECFESCLGRLPDDARALVVEYYREERGAKIEARKRLAASLGIQHGALRLRVHRLCAQLEKCVGDCLKKSAAG